MPSAVCQSLRRPTIRRELQRQANILVPTFSPPARFSIRRRSSVGQKIPTGHEGMAWTTLSKASRGFRRTRWPDLHVAKPMCTRRESHRGEGAESQVTGWGSRQHGPDANSARDAGGDNSGEARQGCSHQHRRCEAMSVLLEYCGF